MLALAATLAHAHPVEIQVAGYPGTWTAGGAVYMGDQVIDLAPGRHALGFVVGVWVDVAEDGTVRVANPGVASAAGRSVWLAPQSGLLRANVSPMTCTVVETPPEAPSDLARLSVFMTGTSWADVWVDGQRLPKTAPLRDFEVAPGPHEIRVANAQAGLDRTETHTFTAGQTLVLRTRIP